MPALVPPLPIDRRRGGVPAPRRRARARRRHVVVVGGRARLRPSRPRRRDPRPARRDEPRDVRRPHPRARGRPGPHARGDHPAGRWSTCSSPTRARCRWRSRSRCACSTSARAGRPGKHRLMTWRGGYHGDTFGAMSVCDPDGGMHALWRDVLPQQVFAERAAAGVRDRATSQELAKLVERARRRAGRGDRRAGRAGRGRHALPRPALPARAARAVAGPRRAAGVRRDRHRVRAHGRAVRGRPRPGSRRTSCASARR